MKTGIVKLISKLIFRLVLAVGLTGVCLSGLLVVLVEASDAEGLNGFGLSAEGGVKADLASGLSFFGEVELNLPSSLEGSSIELNQAYLTRELSWGRLQVGRVRQKWGPGRYGALLLSENVSLDLVQIMAPAGQFEYTQLVAIRDLDAGEYLLAHRLEGEVLKGITVGVTETATVSKGFTAGIYHFIPGFPYYLAQHLAIQNDRTQDLYTNVNLGLDVLVTRFPDLEVYGELLVDDAPGTTEAARRVPPMVGGLIGFRRVDFLGNSAIEASGEYVRINNYVYSHKNPANNYVQNQEEIIGHSLGPDADNLHLSLSYRFSPETTLKGDIEFERQGEGKIGKHWKFEYGTESQFLSGIVEHRTRTRFGVEHQWKPKTTVGLVLGYEDIVNKDHIAGVRGEGWEVRLWFRWVM